MKNLVLPALLVLVVLPVGCRSKDKKKAQLPDGRTPEIGVIETLYQVLDEKSRDRVGFVQKMKYDSGRILYWIYGPTYRGKQGYMLTNNIAFKYAWVNGKRVEQKLSADTINAQVRRVLGYGYQVVLEEIDQREVAKQQLGDRYKKDSAKKPDGEGCGAGDACGCGDG